jgi:hypothetical protein
MKMHEGKALQLFKGVVSHSVLAAAGYGGRFFSPPLHVWMRLLPKKKHAYRHHVFNTNTLIATMYSMRARMHPQCQDTRWGDAENPPGNAGGLCAQHGEARHSCISQGCVQHSDDA